LKVFNSYRTNPAWRLILTALLFATLLCGCTIFHMKTKGVYHRVRSGETLWSIARAYDIKIQELAEANNITDPNLIGLDSVLFIPDADQVVDDVISSVRETGPPVKYLQPEQREEKPPVLKPGKEKPPMNKVPVKPEVLAARDASESKTGEASKSDVKNVSAKRKVDSPVLAAIEPPKQDTGKRIEHKTNGAEADKIKFDKDRFVWPVKGKVRAKFGIQPNGMYYNGIKIAAKESAPVSAAASGIVIFSGHLKDYGDTIIIKHEDNYATVYTNLNNRFVKVDDTVKKGSRIAILGKSQKKGEGLLSFEIRYKNKARNPLFFLP
jgi:lipoprotein NlpD